MTLLQEISVDNKLANRPVAILIFGTLENSDRNIFTACRRSRVDSLLRDMFVLSPDQRSSHVQNGISNEVFQVLQ